MTYYVGSGPYCYAHSLAMVLGETAPAPAVIEVLTGSPFGFQLSADRLPLFDPYGWDPDLGLDAAVSLLGLRCERTAGGTAEEAGERLRAAAARGPVLVGPVDMGLLLHQPGTPTGDDGADHYVVVLEADDGTVLFHDPHGHPYATLPVADFLAAWEAKTIDYTAAPYVMRTGFVRERQVTPEEALRRSLPDARRWLAGRDDLPVPPGTLGGAAGLAALAARGRRTRRGDARLHGPLRRPPRRPPRRRRRPLPGVPGTRRRGGGRDRAVPADRQPPAPPGHRRRPHPGRPPAPPRPDVRTTA